MKRVIFILVTTLLALSSQARAEMLTGPQIREALTGSRIVGINDIGTPYSIWLKHGGVLQGLQGKLNQFDDHGRWWIAGDKLCVQWELWLFAKQTCYGVDLEGDRITRIDSDTRTVIRSTLERGGKS